MKYSDLSKAHRKLKAFGESTKKEEERCDEWPDRTSGDDRSAIAERQDAFWCQHATFKVQLQDALKDQELLRSMTKAQLVQFIAWCGTFRPSEPHVVLSKIGKLSEMLRAEK